MNLLVCQKGIDDMAEHYLAKAGILSVRRVKESDMTSLAKVTGATVVTGLDGLTKSDLGQAGLVEERKSRRRQMDIRRELQESKGSNHSHQRRKSEGH